MPVPTSINDLSTTAASNSPSGSDSPATLDDHIRALASFIASLRDDKADSTDAVLLTGNQTIAGTKTFSSTISGSIDGNAATASSATTAASATTASACSGNSATATKLTTASGSAPSYSFRAWGSLNGTGTPALRASGNVSSVTDLGVGRYQINFTTAMPDANYAILVNAEMRTASGLTFGTTPATGYFDLAVDDTATSTAVDRANVFFGVIR